MAISHQLLANCQLIPSRPYAMLHPPIDWSSKMLSTLGTVGVGLVWGWLVVLVAGRAGRPLTGTYGRTLIAALLLASGGLGSGITLLSGDPWQPLFFFLAAAAGLALHAHLLAALRARS